MTKEEYIDEYIQAELPAPPPAGDNSKAAQLERRYGKLVREQMYHRCADWCKNPRGGCSKRFPVILLLFIYILFLASLF